MILSDIHPRYNFFNIQHKTTKISHIITVTYRKCIILHASYLLIHQLHDNFKLSLNCHWDDHGSNLFKKIWRNSVIIYIRSQVSPIFKQF